MKLRKNKNKNIKQVFIQLLNPSNFTQIRQNYSVKKISITDLFSIFCFNNYIKMRQGIKNLKSKQNMNSTAIFAEFNSEEFIHNSNS